MKIPWAVIPAEAGIQGMDTCLRRHDEGKPPYQEPLEEGMKQVTATLTQRSQVTVGNYIFDDPRSQGLLISQGRDRNFFPRRTKGECTP